MESPNFQDLNKSNDLFSAVLHDIDKELSKFNSPIPVLGGNSNSAVTKCPPTTELPSTKECALKLSSSQSCDSFFSHVPPVLTCSALTDVPISISSEVPTLKKSTWKRIVQFEPRVEPTVDKCTQSKCPSSSVIDPNDLPSGGSGRVSSPILDIPTDAVVADLFEEDSGWWNGVLIDRNFLPFEAQKIKSIPICYTLQEDILIWPKSRDGNYSVKMGYQLLRELENSELASVSDIGENKKFWTDDEVLQSHYDRFQSFQLLAFKKIPKLRELALANIGAINKQADLSKKLSELSPMDLRDLVCHKLKLISEEDPWSERVDFLIEVMVSFFEKQQSQKEAINALPLYPNEQIMWDESLVPSINYSGEGCLALPKLNLQFLTLHDYLLRNFNLFRLESTYEIREDIQEAVPHLLAYINIEGETAFRGWSRMAVPIKEFKITEVKQPNIGEVKPSSVTADVTFTISSYKAQIRSEWNAFKEHDVLFLLLIRLSFGPLSAEEAAKASVPQRLGLQYVRGCEIIEVRDEEGTLMNDFTGRIKRDEWKPPKGELRTVTVALDTAQYHMDFSNIAEKGADDVYGTFNILMRRKPKENNFKAILESIRDLMNEYCIVPDWLHNVFLGYGNPSAAQWTNMPDLLEIVDFKDTFLDADHLKDSFPDYQVCFINPDGRENLQPLPPFRIRLPKTQKGGSHALTGNKISGVDSADGVNMEDTLIVEAYTPPDPGPYPQDQPKQNSVRFTPTQIGAIISGIQPGLTMVVGPPGTGKTDTAVQILNVLYHNCPSQRTLIITHSNQALIDLFEKIMQRDVPARYLLRLGQGEQELVTDLDFSRQGRVNAMLVRQLELLGEVERLARSLQLPEDVGYTCETAGYFWLLHVYSRWEQFLAACAENEDKPTFVKDCFPFKEFFSDTPHPIFMGESFEKDMRAAKGCFRHLKTMFQELEECRAFELLKSTADRANYLMTKQAKIVTMTCTHAALKRKDFLQLGFKYDNLLMEESAQILEIETFIPMLLQRQEDGYAWLKRCILIGDHHQLPPVVKNMAFQKYSHMDQSLFTRFVRLGIPYIELNA
nr:intron-binding protein aquarius [Quercus suber]